VEFATFTGHNSTELWILDLQTYEKEKWNPKKGKKAGQDIKALASYFLSY